MTYIFPYRVPRTQPSSSNAILATSASVAAFLNIPVQTVLTASSVQTVGPIGPDGPTPTCGSGTPGPAGADGPQGDPGQNASCPSGTKLCPQIAPSGSYSIFCVEVPLGCSLEYVICPPDTINPAQWVTPSVFPTPTPTPTPSAPPCLNLGEPCTSNSECCSNNCFDNQCGPEL